VLTWPAFAACMAVMLLAGLASPAPRGQTQEDRSNRPATNSPWPSRHGRGDCHHKPTANKT
jgi:hypothetical protein